MTGTPDLRHTPAAEPQRPARGGEVELQPLRRLCHDVAQELAVIQALVDLAGMEPNLPQRSLRRLEQISARAEFITQMTRQFLEGTAAWVEIDLARLVEEAIEDVQLRTDTNCRLEAGPGRLIADPVMLRRAVVNMLDNAVRAAGPAGSVTVRTRLDGGQALIEVEDTGPGFGHADPGLASLGLGVVRDCAVRHGGEVATGAGESVGALVRLRLPQSPSTHGTGLRD
ncbi:sensor histidine kinase [Kribbella swartbergensis]